jgi:hypothetical protein
MATKYDLQIEQLGNTARTVLGGLEKLAGPMKELRSAEEALGKAARDMTKQEVIDVTSALLDLAFTLAVKGNPVTEEDVKERTVRASVRVLSPLPPHEASSTLIDIAG